MKFLSSSSAGDACFPIKLVARVSSKQCGHLGESQYGFAEEFVMNLFQTLRKLMIEKYYLPSNPSNLDLNLEMDFKQTLK